MKHIIADVQTILSVDKRTNEALYDTYVVTTNCRKAHGERVISDMFELLPSFKSAVSHFETYQSPVIGDFMMTRCGEIGKTLVLLYLFDYYHPNVVPDTQTLYHFLNKASVSDFGRICMVRPGHTQHHFRLWWDEQRPFIDEVYSALDLTICYDPRVEREEDLKLVTNLIRISNVTNK